MQWLEAQGKAWAEALDSGVISQKAGAETARVVGPSTEVKRREEPWAEGGEMPAFQAPNAGQGPEARAGLIKSTRHRHQTREASLGVWATAIQGDDDPK